MDQQKKEQKQEKEKAELPAGEYGRVYFAWQVPEYERPERSRNWYIMAFGAVGVLLLFSFFTLNFLFALIIAAAAFITIMHHSQEPPLVDIRITEEGLQIGQRFYEYEDIKDFAIVYKPRLGVKNVYFEFRQWYIHRISLPLDGVNPVALRKTLLDYIDEDTERTEPPLSESLARLLKL